MHILDESVSATVIIAQSRLGSDVFSYLVPVLLHAALSPRGEGLRQVRKTACATVNSRPC